MSGAAYTTILIMISILLLAVSARAENITVNASIAVNASYLVHINMTGLPPAALAVNASYLVHISVRSGGEEALSAQPGYSILQCAREWYVQRVEVVANLSVSAYGPARVYISDGAGGMYETCHLRLVGNSKAMIDCIVPRSLANGTRFYIEAENMYIVALQNITAVLTRVHGGTVSAVRLVGFNATLTSDRVEMQLLEDMTGAYELANMSCFAEHYYVVSRPAAAPGAGAGALPGPGAIYIPPVPAPQLNFSIPRPGAGPAGILVGFAFAAIYIHLARSIGWATALTIIGGIAASYGAVIGDNGMLALGVIAIVGGFILNRIGAGG